MDEAESILKMKMKNSNHCFNEIDSGEAFQALAASTGSKVINNTIQIPAANGSGIIRKVDFEKGLQIRAWRIKLIDSFEFDYTTLTKTPAELSFTIVYLLSPLSVTLHSGTLSKETKFQGGLNIIVLSENTDVRFTTVAGQEVRALDITVTAEWLKEQFSDADSILELFIKTMQENSDPSLYLDLASAFEFRIAADLHDHALTGNRGLLYLKAKTLSLVSDFFTQTFKNSGQAPENNVHQEKMLMVEKLLEQHFEKELPSIERIAREAALSESTLKRHFKLMFGKSLYEFYLEKKMEYAKGLLTERAVTVKEVAYRLGYEKPSNFIHIFKKFHSLSPGHFKKNSAFR